MVFNRRLGRTFKKSSLEYHLIRRGYPNNLFTDIIKFSGITKASIILDAGCGSGLSTLPFAKKGYSIIGIDFSEELLKIAKSEAINDVPEYLLGSFENYNFKQKFDLIISGQAFHWFDEKIAYKKCIEILNNKGYLAIFAKFHDYKRSDFLLKLKNIFEKNCEFFPEGLHHHDYEKDYIREIKDSNLFTNIKSKTYEYFLEYLKEGYRDYIISNTWMIKLDVDKQANVMNEIDSLMSNYKWPMKIPFGAVLVIGRRYSKILLH